MKGVVFIKSFFIKLIIIFSIIIFITIDFKILYSLYYDTKEINFIENKIDRNKLEKNDIELNYKINNGWFIEIEKIALRAEIKEGTDMDILENYVGHFKETQNLYGNIGLAAHNRGYKNNYFENISKLELGDEIKYEYNGISKVYEVCVIDIIDETDWSYLEDTKENKITLITCIENMPELRRCVQAIEKS